MHTTELPVATKIQPALIVFLLVFATCIFGIESRPTGLLSAFWPTNAVLLAMLVRYPLLASRVGWVMAVLGYLAADLITGSTPGSMVPISPAWRSGFICLCVYRRR